MKRRVWKRGVFMDNIGYPLLILLVMLAYAVASTFDFKYY